MAECSCCGDCCENIFLNTTKTDLRGSDDPNADFVIEHWHRSGGGGTRTRWTCDLLDRTTRLCTAHDERPPLCRDFPWYEGTPDEPGLDGLTLPRRCAYWADRPAEERPTEWVPVEIARSA